MKTIKITLITSMLLLVLFLPAIQIGMPTVEACKPNPPADLTEPVTIEEEQEIMNTIESSQLVNDAIRWLKERGITVDLSKHLIIKFSENITSIIPELNRYVVLLFEVNSTRKHKGGIYITLDLDKSIQNVYALYIKPIGHSNTFVEAIDVKNRKTIYILSTEKDARTYNDGNIIVTSSSDSCTAAGYVGSCEGTYPYNCESTVGCGPSRPGYYTQCGPACVDWNCIAQHCFVCIIPCLWQRNAAACSGCVIVWCGLGSLIFCCREGACCCVEKPIPGL